MTVGLPVPGTTGENPHCKAKVETAGIEPAQHSRQPVREPAEAWTWLIWLDDTEVA